MKKIEAYIRASKLKGVREALRSIGLSGLTAIEACGFGDERGDTVTYRGVKRTVDEVSRVKLEIIVSNHQVDDVVQIIDENARTGQTGDGRIIVVDLDRQIRIGRGETIDTTLEAEPAPRRLSPAPMPLRPLRSAVASPSAANFGSAYSR